MRSDTRGGGLLVGLVTTMLSLGVISPVNTRAAEFKGVLRFPCGESPLPACATVLSSLKDDGMKRVLEQARDESYSGKIFPNGRNDVEGRELTSVSLGETPICSVLPLLMNDCMAEEQKNRKAEECGSLAKLHFVNPPVKVFTLPHSRGGKESAWVAGGFLAALQEVGTRMSQEIGENRLAVDGTSACVGGATDFFRLAEKFTTSENLSTLAGCKDQGLAFCTAQKYFDAALESLKAAYLQVARCALYEESLRRYRDYTRDFLPRITRDVADACAVRCGTDAACLPTCYTARATGWVRDDLAARFPGAASGCTGSGAPTGGIR